MIKTYSQRLLPPYYGLAQIAESERARAITVDGKLGKFNFFVLVMEVKVEIIFLDVRVSISDGEN